MVLLALVLGFVTGAAVATAWHRAQDLERATPSPAPPSPPPAPPREIESESPAPDADAQPAEDDAPAPTAELTAAHQATLDRLAAAEEEIARLNQQFTLAMKALQDFSMRLEVRSGELRPFRGDPSLESPLVPMSSGIYDGPLPSETADGPLPRLGDNESLPRW